MIELLAFELSAAIARRQRERHEIVFTEVFRQVRARGLDPQTERQAFAWIVAKILDDELQRFQSELSVAAVHATRDGREVQH